MIRKKPIRVALAVVVAAIAVSLAGCAGLLERPAVPQAVCTHGVPSMMIDSGWTWATLQDVVREDRILIIEGIITLANTRFITDTSATQAELDERQANGLPIGHFRTEYEVTIGNVLKGESDSPTITVAGLDEVQVGDRVILFLLEVSGDPTVPSGQTIYSVAHPIGQFRIEKDNTLSAHSLALALRSPLADAYCGKDKSVLEKDIQDLVAQLPKPTRDEALQNAVNAADLVIEGMIQGIGEAHFVNAMEKPQEWIDQMLAEGKMPGLVLTDYTIVIDKVLSDKRIYYPRFFPNYEPIEPGQTIIVTRQGGTYQGVTQIEEPGPPFEIGSREVLFLVGFSLTNYDIPDDGQIRYSTDSLRGRLLIGPDGRLTAFTR
ncbi:MAG TPA: hypothetical protein VFL17_19945, partial [Anaerolineae bacterium]|nr:hypothetical protein [Anaerolineae bacterium]